MDRFEVEEGRPQPSRGGDSPLWKILAGLGLVVLIVVGVVVVTGGNSDVQNNPTNTNPTVPPPSPATSKLLEAIEDGDKAALEQALTEGSMANATYYVDDGTERTVLSDAAESAKSTAEIVQLLLSKGAKYDSLCSNNATALFYAAKRSDDDTETVKIVDALITAAGAKSAEYLAMKDVDQQRPLHWAALSGGAVDTIFAKDGTALEARAKFAENMNHAHTDATPLLMAVAKNQLGSVKKLLAHSASATAVDKQMETCLHIATEITEQDTDKDKQASTQIVEALIEANPPPNANAKSQPFDNTALHEAAAANKAWIIMLLVNNAHADVNIPNGEQQTPLMIAAQKGHVEALEKLLQSGADKALKDADGKTALDLASTPAVEALLTDPPSPTPSSSPSPSSTSPAPSPTASSPAASSPAATSPAASSPSPAHVTVAIF